MFKADNLFGIPSSLKSWAAQYLPLVFEALAKYEHGCALYYARAATRFESQSTMLASIYQRKALMELKHARAFHQFSGNQTVPIPNKLPESWSDWSLVNYSGSPEFIDGNSSKYRWARFYFQGKTASELDVINSLAFQIVGEVIESFVYHLLVVLLDYLDDYNFLRISLYAEDETSEVGILWFLMKENSRYPRWILLNWYLKGFGAIAIFIWDLIWGWRDAISK